jgi:basic membrane lipoprotein Med (substrate-binding protein (PBP1-ABC) superfamily)
MSACRTTCKASTRWTARLSVLACALALGACEPKGAAAGKSCGQLRERFDKSFADAVNAGVRKARDEQKKYLREGQETYLAMERQGCCRQDNVCPPLNVH